MKKIKPIYKDSIDKIKKEIESELGIGSIQKKKLKLVGEYK